VSISKRWLLCEPYQEFISDHFWLGINSREHFQRLTSVVAAGTSVDYICLAMICSYQGQAELEKYNDTIAYTFLIMQSLERTNGNKGKTWFCS
jgi:hypothetical protein